MQINCMRINRFCLDLNSEKNAFTGIFERHVIVYAQKIAYSKTKLLTSKQISLVEEST